MNTAHYGSKASRERVANHVAAEIEAHGYCELNAFHIAVLCDVFSDDAQQWLDEWCRLDILEHEPVPYVVQIVHYVFPGCETSDDGSDGILYMLVENTRRGRNG